MERTSNIQPRVMAARVAGAHHVARAPAARRFTSPLPPRSTTSAGRRRQQSGLPSCGKGNGSLSSSTSKIAPWGQRRVLAAAAVKQPDQGDLSRRPGMGVLRHDPDLENHKDHLTYRWGEYCKLKGEIESRAGGLENFSRGYDCFGFTKASDGGIVYREWIPAALEVSLVGDFNNWNTNATPMRRSWGGVYECRLPPGSIPHGSRVRVRVLTPHEDRVDRLPAWITWATQNRLEEGDYGFDGIYWDPNEADRFPGFRAPTPPRPVTPRIYEAHVGMSSSRPLVNSYLDFAQSVLPRIKAAGYNTLQLMAVMEHAYYGSFGYHVTNPFAVSSRSGTPDEFKVLVERAHEMGIRVLLDVVHSHVSTNEEDGLNGFDFGQPEDQQYFHVGSRGYHKLWDSRLWNFKNWEVLRYLLSNLRWWMEEYNLDGFRFDGVTSMLYHHHGLNVAFSGDYSEYMGVQSDVESAVYLMLANDMLHEMYPEVTTIAEEVSGLPAVCLPALDMFLDREGGIGFDYRLAMGIPDLWVRLVDGVRDEDWSMGLIVEELCRRRIKVEKTIAYVECHDQCIVGSHPMAYKLIGDNVPTEYPPNQEWYLDYMDVASTTARPCSLESTRGNQHQQTEPKQSRSNSRSLRRRKKRAAMKQKRGLSQKLVDSSPKLESDREVTSNGRGKGKGSKGRKGEKQGDHLEERNSALTEPRFSTDAQKGMAFRLMGEAPDEKNNDMRDVEQWQSGDTLAQTAAESSESRDRSIIRPQQMVLDLTGSEIKQQDKLAMKSIHRGTSLHKMTRLLTMCLGGEGYLNFMGNEFAHPGWVDFPREGNKFSHSRCCRKWDLADDPERLHKAMRDWDCAIQWLEEETRFMNADHLWCSSQNEEDKVIVVERNELLFVFNLHPTNHFINYKVGAPNGGKYVLLLDSDARAMGGQGRVLAEEELQPVECAHDGRAFTLTIPVLPSRTCQVRGRREPHMEIPYRNVLMRLLGTGGSN